MGSGVIRMIFNMLVNRKDNWIIAEDIELNSYYMSITLLEKLSTNRKKGIKYNRINILRKNGSSICDDSFKNLDIAILILISRKLIYIKEDNQELTAKLFITDKGLDTLDIFKKELEQWKY